MYFPCRILRALRPLRIIARARGLRLLVTTIMSAVKPVLNTLCIAIAVFAVLGILGMQLLSGKMYSCSDTLIHRKKDCVELDGEGNPRTWNRYDFHFDNIFQAIRTMFILATQDDWPSHMVCRLICMLMHKLYTKPDYWPFHMVCVCVCVLCLLYANGSNVSVYSTHIFVYLFHGWCKLDGFLILCAYFVCVCYLYLEYTCISSTYTSTIHKNSGLH